MTNTTPNFGGKLNFRVPLDVASNPEKLHAACMAHLTHPAHLMGQGMSHSEALEFLSRISCFSGMKFAG
jgi:hypothetical protein